MDLMRLQKNFALHGFPIGILKRAAKPLPIWHSRQPEISSLSAVL